MLPEHYVTQDENQDCRLEFNKSKDNKWVLGLPMLKGFYSAFDLNKKQMAFGPLKLTTKSQIVQGTVPT